MDYTIKALETFLEVEVDQLREEIVLIQLKNKRQKLLHTRSSRPLSDYEVGRTIPRDDIVYKIVEIYRTKSVVFSRQ